MRCSKLRASGLLTTVLFLSACGAVSSDPPQPAPTLVQYEQTTLDRVADDLALLPEDSPLHAMMADYAMVRDQIRAMRGE